MKNDNFVWPFVVPAGNDVIYGFVAFVGTDILLDFIDFMKVRDDESESKSARACVLRSYDFAGSYLKHPHRVRPRMYEIRPAAHCVGSCARSAIHRLAVELQNVPAGTQCYQVQAAIRYSQYSTGRLHNVSGAPARSEDDAAIEYYCTSSSKNVKNLTLPFWQSAFRNGVSSNSSPTGDPPCNGGVSA